MCKPVRALLAVLLAALAVAAGGAGHAAEKVKAAVGQRGAWDTMVTLFAAERGFFRDEGLEVEILWTRGGAETLQAVITGSVEFGIANGLAGVLGALEKRAPVRIVSAQMTGAGDLFWYVRTESPIRGMKDMNGRTMAYSRPGSSSHLVAQALARQAGVTPRFVSAGAVPDTRTQVMSGQLDAGWGNPPFILDLEGEGKVRMIANGNDVPALREQTVRVNVANAAFLKSRREAARGFMKAYARALAWMYEAPDAAVKRFAEENKVGLEVARRSVGFFPRSALTLAPIAGLEASMAEAVEFKNIARPFTKEELGQLIDLVYDATK
ncbi:MAG TPA: ABC transporter substrate-binding protein [Methylomirabilota bacterium]|jgi:NitT/TauT family transport system substrate-binding protein|nr:ABC transporter substrate-binding protein [Methylomirabilota bacterium]